MLMRYASTELRIVIVYRTSHTSLFFDEFPCLLERLAITSTPLIITGDFNFHVDVANDPHAMRFLDLIDAFNLKQHMDVPTHRSGHTLDLIITRADDKIAKNFHVHDPVISDHFAVHCQLALLKPPFEKKEISYRKLRSIDKTAFCDDIAKSPLMTVSDFMSTSELVDLYNKELSDILEQHAPLKKCIVTLRPAAPWYSDEIRKEKSKRRKLERKWRTTRLTIDRQIYAEQCNTVNSLISSSKKKYYSSIIADHKSDQKVLFSSFDKMLNRKPEKLLPHSETSNELANKFVDFFAEKITRIRNNMDMNSSVIIETPLSATMLSVFEQTNPDELSTLIQASACKSSDLDPLPGAVMTDCFHVLLPVITRIVNLSMTTGTVPIAMKEASLSPLLKRPSLDHEQFPNFRPISNLPFISKCTKKVVASRLTSHVNNNNLSRFFSPPINEVTVQKQH